MWWSLDAQVNNFARGDLDGHVVDGKLETAHEVEVEFVALRELECDPRSASIEAGGEIIDKDTRIVGRLQRRGQLVPDQIQIELGYVAHWWFVWWRTRRRREVRRRCSGSFSVCCLFHAVDLEQCGVCQNGIVVL